MRRISLLQTFDGKMFDDERKASAHEEDKLGEELDGLLKLYDLKMGTYTDIKRGLLQLLPRKRELRQSCEAILRILDSIENVCDEEEE